MCEHPQGTVAKSDFHDGRGILPPLDDLRQGRDALHAGWRRVVEIVSTISSNLGSTPRRCSLARQSRSRSEGTRVLADRSGLPSPAKRRPLASWTRSTTLARLSLPAEGEHGDCRTSPARGSWFAATLLTGSPFVMPDPWL
jgi:hypothetical protein